MVSNKIILVYNLTCNDFPVTCYRRPAAAAYITWYTRTYLRDLHVDLFVWIKFVINRIFCFRVKMCALVKRKHNLHMIIIILAHTSCCLYFKINSVQLGFYEIL